MKKLIYPILSLVMLFGATSCGDDFFDINTNPNSPTEESITPQLIMPRALHATAARMATSYDFSAHWMGYWARSGTYGPSTEQESYNITNTYQQDEWNGWYDILTDVNLMEKKATVANQNYYLGAAKVMKSIGFMYLVDQYNNVPYSKAFDLSGNILPAYDQGADIYDSLLIELDEAAALFAQPTEDAANPGFAEADIMFGGDATMWRKLVNTQRLKLLVRQSEVPGFNPSAEIAKIEADGSGFLMSGETAAVNPGYAAVDGQQNPFYNTYKESALGATDQYNRANNYVLNKMKNSGDVRYQYYFSEAAVPLNNNLYYGYNFGEVLPNNDPYKHANSSDVAGPGLAKSASQDQWLFTSVESLFLQAEATQRGWLAGDAKAAYEAAVTESFKWLKVANAEAAAQDYLANGGTISSWDDATDKIRLIVMQKYLALVGINNFEAWVDYRRVGVPADLPLSLAPSRGGNGIPKRLLYPQSEYSYNAANVAKEGTISAQTSTVFWDN
ncbi:SusD/RagB family nutrient-binding outer membrane lipoprotein [Pontibacter sp. KCTC 32443]|uniref:SusD/RagB family nutrient-binding outer membrane lipoprotein n=1 Tax=Pontibacter TaxID=323449 RepID=UPI00164EA356|nr:MULTISPECIES: SusD/RagB family nutrient-binding outer membrane lipoprotein [Pontibacter]MBC5775978.1 SusD/RagB family nutrient-binding outer membrane lipoprotein [Pontibacter sp. KCTC 32443]